MMASLINVQLSWQFKPRSMQGNRAYRSIPKMGMWEKSTLLRILERPGRSLNPLRSAMDFASVATAVSRDAGSCSSEATTLVSTVGAAQMPPTSLKAWNLTDRHLLLLNVIACVAAVSASCLFFAAIPTLMAFKKAAESLEKLLDVTREELPGTMAAVRLSGMEISDLTMELSDLGQEITEGVRSSARAVRVAEDGLRRMTNMASVAFLQEQATVQAKMMKPAMARTARSLHDGLVQGRGMLQSLIALKRLSSWLSRYWGKRRKQLQDKAKGSDNGIGY